MFRFNSGARGRLCFAKMDVVRVILLLCFPAGSDKIKTNYKNCFYFEGRCGMPKVAYSEEDRERDVYKRQVRPLPPELLWLCIFSGKGK